MGRDDALAHGASDRGPRLRPALERAAFARCLFAILRLGLSAHTM